MISTQDIAEDHFPFVVSMASEYFSGRMRHVHRRAGAPYDLAILVDEKDKHPPSDQRALSKFVKAGEKVGFNVELITKNDYHRLSEYDALFIRETTNVNHYTFRFAQRAAAEGLVVIDDPNSILKCSNKVYLAELLTRYRIPMPRTHVVTRSNIMSTLQVLGLPIVLKQPDSSFSRGVVKVDNLRDYKAETARLLERSDLIVAQEFLPTEFDWRVGVLNRRALYVCKYFMAKRHWQIINHSSGKSDCGPFESVSVEDAPPAVLETAVKAANLIGDGLYGVDLKTVGDKPYIIEINDNPNIDAGVEDKVLKDELYVTIMQLFYDRIRRRKQPQNEVADAPKPAGLQ